MGGAAWFSLISRYMVTLPVWAARLSLILEAGYHSPFAVNQEVTLTELLAVPLVKDRFALFPAADVGSQEDGKASPGQKKRTTQDQHHAQGLALCHDVTLDIVTHRWVPAGHPQYTGAREGRLWVAQAQTQLTLFVDPQSLSLECEHGSGAEGSKRSLDQGPSPNLFISTVLDETANAGQYRQAASRRRCESDPQSHKETTSMLNEKRSEKLTDEDDPETDVDGCIRQATNSRRDRGSCSQHHTGAYSGNESQSRLRHGHVARSRQLKQ